MAGAVPMQEFSEIRSEVHSLRRDLDRVSTWETDVLERLRRVELEVHLLVKVGVWSAGIIGVSIAGLIVAIVTKGIR